MLGGVGFTVSLFVIELVCKTSMLVEDARRGVLVVLIAGVIGCAIVVPSRVSDRLVDAASSPTEP